MWERIEPLIPPERAKPKGGRPRNDNRKMMEAIFYVLRTGIQWKALPRSIAAGSSAHDRFQEWLKAGVFHRMWQAGLVTYDQVKQIEWEWQSMDGVMTKAPLGGAATGPNPTDRAKTGTKRCLLTDGRGVPLALQVVGANRPDMKVTEATLANHAIDRPKPTARKPQHLCLDAGFDYDEIRQIVEAYGYVAHIRSRTDEAESKRKIPGYRARRWVVERTHSWMNRFRRILIRWEKKVENYLAMLEFACAYIAFHVAEVFG
ncbi:MAG: IS5 family transposase [Anaerolineales bacterium]|nr:IS5 family transposase [Anaerolineales bacterium]